MQSTRIKLFSLFLVLLLAILACGGSDDSGSLVATADSGTSLNESPDLDADGDSEELARPAFYSMGEIIEIDDLQIALAEVELNGNILEASFVIKNNGNSEETISTILSFSAKNENAESLEEEIFDCDPSLGGTIVPGGVMRGKICWSAGSLPVRLYFQPGLFSSNTIAWEALEQGSSVVEMASNIATSYEIGDVIEIDDHTVSVQEAELSNGRLEVTFLIENLGDDEMTVSSLLSFDSINEIGESLELDIFDCEPGIDGTIIASDRTRGKVCWKGATYPATVIYDASFLGSGGTIVWIFEE
jgi:hypothetical protein